VKETCGKGLIFFRSKILFAAATPMPAVVIIGAGPCGLGAAVRMEELRFKRGVTMDWILFESSGEAGGLASTFTDDQGFLWDVGGHVIFSHYKYFTDLLNRAVASWKMHEREAWVWMRDRFVPYPLQNNLWRLPQSDILKCIDGLLELDRLHGTVKAPTNFEEWLLNSFGKGICEVFLIPYNEKVWAYPPREMNTEWMGERVAAVDTKRCIEGILKQSDSVGWGPNATFRFPLFGGTGGIWKAVRSLLPADKLSFGQEVLNINGVRKEVLLSNGCRHPYHAVISSMPLTTLLGITTGPTFGDTVPSLVTKFRHSSSHIIGFGFRGLTPDHLKSKCWMYFPEDSCPFYRATVFSNYSPHNVPHPDREWSLMLEVSESPLKSVDEQAIISLCEQGLPYSLKSH